MRGEGGWFPKGVLSTPKPIKKGQHLSRRTEYKKGQPSRNKLPVGSITVRNNKAKKSGPRHWIKIAELPDRWMLYAQWVWINAHGPIPDGCVIHHMDENSLNDSLDNLALVTPKQHHEYHKEYMAARLREEVALPKNLLCASCGSPFVGKKLGGFCNPCRRISRKKTVAKYNQKIRGQ